MEAKYNDISYSFPPGGLQGGFRASLSFPLDLRLSFASCLYMCFPNHFWVTVVWAGLVVAGAVVARLPRISLTCCSTLRGSFSE